MVINLSEETIQTVYNSLRDTRHSLRWRLESRNVTPSKKEIYAHQLAEVEDALQVFGELLDSL